MLTSRTVLGHLRRFTPSILGSALVLSTLWWGVPRFRAVLENALEMRVVPMSERRAIAIGAWYPEAEKLREGTPPGAAIDLIMASAGDGDLTLQVGAALHRRDVRYFRGWEAWRRRERARFFDVAPGVDGVPAPPPGPATAVILLDRTADVKFRIVTPP